MVLASKAVCFVHCPHIGCAYRAAGTTESHAMQAMADHIKANHWPTLGQQTAGN